MLRKRIASVTRTDSGQKIILMLEDGTLVTISAATALQVQVK